MHRSGRATDGRQALDLGLALILPRQSLEQQARLALMALVMADIQQGSDPIEQATHP